jgi:uncharacterized spore protein YtfJ
MNNLNDVLGKITEFLKSEAKTETIIGQQFKLGEFTCVPIMSVGLGFGGGGGEGKGGAKQAAEGEGTGSAGAGGMGLSPIGFLATRGSEIQFISAQASKGLNSVFEKLPGMIEKYFDKKNTSVKM